jgi:hypothetical protein
LVANTSTALQTTLAADAQLAEGDSSYMRSSAEQRKVSDIPSRHSETNTKEQNLKPE